MLELGERFSVGEENLRRAFGGGFADVADARGQRYQDQRVKQQRGGAGCRDDGDAAPGGMAQAQADVGDERHGRCLEAGQRLFYRVSQRSQ